MGAYSREYGNYIACTCTCVVDPRRHQSEVSGAIDQSELTPANAVYVWMDWVRLYLEHLHRWQAENVPISDRYGVCYH